jgi:hypothetical protein
MASAKKILASMRKNAKNWRIQDLQTLARHYGIAYRQKGTSHVFFTFDFHVQLRVPAGGRSPAHKAGLRSAICRTVGCHAGGPKG